MCYVASVIRRATYKNIKRKEINYFIIIISFTLWVINTRLRTVLSLPPVPVALDDVGSITIGTIFKRIENLK